MSGADEERTPGEKRDLFYRGIVSKLFPSNKIGVVRGETGREIPFSYQLVILLGEITDPYELREGEEVGYDVGWTSNGLRITKIKTYPRPPSSEGGSSLEGQGGQGQEMPS